MLAGRACRRLHALDMPNDTPTRRALLIGIDKYDTHPEVIGPLQGCVNDVTAMERLLRAAPYAFEHITVLRDGDATQAGIRTAFDALVEETQTDDVVVVQYAGHGSTKHNMSGEEASGYDST